LLVLEFVINVVCGTQVSSVTDHVGNQDTTAKSADFDDDEGGLVSVQLKKNKNGFYRKFVITFLIVFVWIISGFFQFVCLD